MGKRLRRVATAALASAAAAAAFGVTAGVGPTDAAWIATRTLGVTATAVTPAAPTDLACGASSGLLGLSVPFTWTAPPGPAPSHYTLSWTAPAAGSATFTTTSGTVPSTLLLGTRTVRIAANYGTWQSAAGTQTRSVTVVAFGVVWTCS